MEQLHKIYQSRYTATNSWWRAKWLRETCRVVIPIKLEFGASVGFIHKESVTMHGHKIVKFIRSVSPEEEMKVQKSGKWDCQVISLSLPICFHVHCATREVHSNCNVKTYRCLAFFFWNSKSFKPYSSKNLMWNFSNIPR